MCPFPSLSLLNSCALSLSTAARKRRSDGDGLRGLERRWQMAQAAMATAAVGKSLTTGPEAAVELARSSWGPPRGGGRRQVPRRSARAWRRPPCPLLFSHRRPSFPKPAPLPFLSPMVLPAAKATVGGGLSGGSGAQWPRSGLTTNSRYAPSNSGRRLSKLQCWRQWSSSRGPSSDDFLSPPRQIPNEERVTYFDSLFLLWSWKKLTWHEI